MTDRKQLSWQIDLLRVSNSMGKKERGHREREGETDGTDTQYYRVACKNHECRYAL